MLVYYEMENPVNYGTIVEKEYFTDRVNEVAYIKQFLKRANHLVLISLCLFGKSSVVAKVVKESKPKHITVNLQQTTSVLDLSADTAVDYNVKSHGLDYERLWMRFNRTNYWILQRLASGKPLKSSEYRTSTVYSAQKRFQKDVYVIYSDQYEIEDSFFRQWVVEGDGVAPLSCTLPLPKLKPNSIQTHRVNPEESLWHVLEQKKARNNNVSRLDMLFAIN